MQFSEHIPTTQSLPIQHIMNILPNSQTTRQSRTLDTQQIHKRRPLPRLITLFLDNIKVLKSLPTSHGAQFAELGSDTSIIQP